MIRLNFKEKRNTINDSVTWYVIPSPGVKLYLLLSLRNLLIMLSD